MQPRKTSGRSAFTIVELLVVIAVIAILVGIVSALLGGMTGKALETHARDMCSQVAETWMVIAVTEGRLPDKDFVKDTTDCVELGDGDLAVRMTPAAIVLFNDWHKATAIPAADSSKFRVRVGKTEHVARQDAVDFLCLGNGNPKQPQQWRMEPGDTHLLWGFFAPWVQRKIDEMSEDAETTGTEFDDEVWNKTKTASAEWGHGIVTAAIDTDGDGKITIPAGMIDNAEDIELRTTAVAWVWNEKKTKTIRSW